LKRERRNLRERNYAEVQTIEREIAEKLREE
jgi:hypothetical protein